MPNSDCNQKQTSQLKIKPWIIQPFLFICGVWFLHQNLFVVKEKTPDVFFGIWQHSNISLNAYIPSFPTDHAQILKLGELFGRLDELQTHNLTNPAYIQEINEILQLKSPLNPEKYHLIKNRLVESTVQGSLLSKVLGVFSFVNILWLISICGIMVFFYPFAEILLGPIIKRLGKIIIDFLVFMSPSFEPLSYLLSYLLIVQGFRYLPEVGLFISLTGCLMFAGLIIYSDAKHKNRDHGSEEVTRLKCQFFYLFLTAAWAPIAILYQSRLIGFFTVASFFSFLGFTVVCRGLCWLVGYETEEIMQRASASSLLLMITFILIKLKVIIVSNMLLFEPFSTGVLTFGMIAFFLARLIISSRHYYPLQKYSFSDYFSSQLMMIGSLFIALLIGNIYQLAPLYNIGLTFTVLYIVEKIYETDLKEEYLVVILFLTSVAIYFISMYLRTHPDFIVNMFDADFVLN